MKKETIRTIVVQKILENKHLFLNQKVAVATSGGVDSMVLLDIFSKLRQKYGIILYSLHYNHNWREKSAYDAELIRDYCKKNNIKFIYKQDKGRILKKEEEARNKRNYFFKECAKKEGLKIVCTGHHLNDQLETVLFRLIRGTGPQGLSPIKELLSLDERTIIFRPFLTIKKSEVANYARTNKIRFNEDETNLDLKYKRNLIRNKILPLLKDVNKNAEKNIILCSNLIHSQNEVLKDYFLHLIKKLQIKNSFIWKRKVFLRLGQLTQKSFLYWYFTLNSIKGSVSKIDFILSEISQEPSIFKKIDLDKNFYVEITDDKIAFLKKEMRKVRNNNHLSVNFLLNSKKERVRINEKYFLELTPYKLKRFSLSFVEDREMVAYVDLSNFLKRRLTVRYRKPHDKFQPLGFAQEVKLKKYLINKKIPFKTRYNLPLLCFKNKVLWIPGYSLSEKLKVIKKPTHILKLK